MSRHPWTAAQIAFLRQHAAQWSLPRLTRELLESVRD